MGWVTIAAIFLVVWWTALFAILPWGVRGQAEDDSIVKGTEPGAPVKDMMWRKAAVTTGLATAITAAFVASVEFGWLDWESWPFLPDLPEGYSVPAR